MNVAAKPPVFDPVFLRSLERLRINTRALGEGKFRAERRSKRMGASLEFAEHRDYTFGDDPRRLDWNAFARLDRLLIKLLHEEEDLHVLIVVDASGSMQWSEIESEPQPKFVQACRLAAALTCVGLASQHRVTLGWVGESLGPWIGPLRGMASLHQAIAFLKAAPAQRNLPTRLAAALGQTANLIRGRSIVIVLSDFLDPAGFEPGLRRLMYRHCELVALQISHPLELAPVIGDDTRLTDVETQASVDLADDAIATYQARRAAFDLSLAAWCNQRGVTHYHAMSNDDPLNAIRDLIRKGILSQ